MLTRLVAHKEPDMQFCLQAHVVVDESGCKVIHNFDGTMLVIGPKQSARFYPIPANAASKKIKKAPDHPLSESESKLHKNYLQCASCQYQS